MKCIPLPEGTFTIDHTKKFVPYELGADKMEDRSRGSLLVEIQPFVVVTSTDTILLDTGLGFMQFNKLQLHENLSRAGIDPGSVSKVLLSHLHKDHAGGASMDIDGNGSVLSFPNATYYVQAKELDYAYEKGFPSYITSELDALKNNRQVVLVEGNGKIGDQIEYMLSGAHCPYHQVFWIRENGQTAFYGGDEAPQLQQMKHRFIAKYDYDGRKAMELRTLWWEQGQKEGWTFLFCHDHK